jgi:hypothetical protein
LQKKDKKVTVQSPENGNFNFKEFITQRRRARRGDIHAFR